MAVTDMQIRAVRLNFEDFKYRTPIKFGGVALDRATILNVECDVETGAGKRATGKGSMPLGNVWSFPSKRLSYEETLQAMKVLAQHVGNHYGQLTESGHPIDLTWILEKEFPAAAESVRKELQLKQGIPMLCTLVVASPFDAALHDAYGRVHDLNCYATYSKDFLPHDLGHYLGSAFAGERLESYLRKDPKPELPLYHLVGALDPLEESDIEKRIGDGWPETLPEWIQFNGLTHLKIKLNGDSLDWDVERVLRVDQVTAEVQKKRGVKQWYYSLDFNERCQNVDYLLDMLHEVQKENPAGFERIQYIEQPTARDLKSHRENTMHQAARLRPVVIDESLTDLESLLLAQEMGYTGVALKACKGQTQSLLLAAAAQKFGMFLCVQDLTCPGASLIHSAGLAAHVPGVHAIEANARQYMPQANIPWEKRFPGIFHITDGQMRTGELTGVGLST